MQRKNVIYQKSFDFAINIVKLYKYLCAEKKEYVISKQVLKSGTSIGANIKEALAAQSKKDFVAKLYVASKEASETEYWLELLIETEYLEPKQGELLLQDLEEIQKLLSSIIITTKRNHKV